MQNTLSIAQLNYNIVLHLYCYSYLSAKKWNFKYILMLFKCRKTDTSLACHLRKWIAAEEIVGRALLRVNITAKCFDFLLIGFWKPRVLTSVLLLVPKYKIIQSAHCTIQQIILKRQGEVGCWVDSFAVWTWLCSNCPMTHVMFCFIALIQPLQTTSPGATAFQYRKRHKWWHAPYSICIQRVHLDFSKSKGGKKKTRRMKHIFFTFAMKYFF